MQLTPDTSFSNRFARVFTNKDYYTAPTGAEVSVKKGTGNVEYTDDGVIKIYDAQKVSVYGTKEDDKILVKNSSINHIYTGKGDNKTFLDNCTYKNYSSFFGTGSTILTGGRGMFDSYKSGSDVVKINGDFNGGVLAQQGEGSFWGDKKAHKDIIMINGNNNGVIQIDSKDKVSVRGEKGSIINTSVIPM